MSELNGQRQSRIFKHARLVPIERAESVKAALTTDSGDTLRQVFHLGG